MKKYLLILLTALAFNCFGQKIPHSIVNGAVKIQGVDGTNPVIYCNDMFFDSPEGFYLWLKANRKEINLVGNISTRNMYLPPNIKNSHESTWKEWVEAYDKAQAIGLKNIVPPIKGSDDYLRKPASGVIEQTQRKDSPGSDLIISEARKASEAKPLVIFDGGFVTSLANAYLKDNSIADKVVIIHIDGFENTQHNGVDYWATEIVMKKFRYIDWHGSFINNQVTWYDPFRPLQVTLNMPVNPWTNLLKDNYYSQSYALWHDLGDAPGALWFFDNSLWKNVVRRTANRQTTTSNTFDYLLVSDNDWSKYGPMFSAYMNNPTNYIPATTIPPVEPPVEPPVQTQTPYKTLTIPGKIEAEDYDNGGEGVAYHDTDVTNNGGKYRTNGVDIEGNFNIGWVFDGEWLEYTTNVTAGSYKIEFRVASQTVGGSRFELKLDGVSIGTINTPLTGGSQNYQTVSFNATITGGTKVLRLDVLKGHTNIDFIQFTPVGVEPPVNTPPIISILTSNTTYPAGSSIIITATASDDKSVAKVEFFNGSVKLGESLTSPYSWVINNAAAGTYNLTGKATDNEGASTVSSVRLVTVGEAPTQPTGEKVFDITKAPYLAKGNGIDNDGPAIQAAIDAAIKANGKLIIPAASNYYKTTQTIYIQPKAPESQAYISIEGSGKYWSQIVYEGPSNSSAVVIIGLKAGSSIKGTHVKLGNGVSGSVCYSIGTSLLSTSTSGFSFDNCNAELNRGVGNIGFEIGKIDQGGGADISQIDWKNTTVWAPFAIIPNQVGWHFAGHNSLFFNIASSSTVFCETGIKVTAGGVITLTGYGSSQNSTELWMSHSTQVSFTGGRFESSKRFLRVEPSANFTGVSISGSLISDFKPTDGKLFDFQGNGGLDLVNVKIESPFDWGPGMISLGNGVGTLSIRGGAFNASDPFLTQGGWRAKIENVVRLNKDYQAIGYFTNK